MTPARPRALSSAAATGLTSSSTLLRCESFTRIVSDRAAGSARQTAATSARAGTGMASRAGPAHQSPLAAWRPHEYFKSARMSAGTLDSVTHLAYQGRDIYLV